MHFSQLERLYQTTKKWKLDFQKYKLLWKFILQNVASKCSFKTAFFQTSIFKFYLLSPISALLLPTCSTSSFQILVEKVQNYTKEVRLILKKWVWGVDFEPFFLFFQTKKNSRNQRDKLIFAEWVKLFLYNFRLFQQVFENLKLNKLVKEERRLDLEDRIWRLKFGKTQFWSCILKNEFESLYFLKG